ncbi:MAG: OmpA family protein [Nitrospiraceae bacterium]
MNTHMETLAELEETRKTSAQTAEAFESFKKKSAADLERLQQDKAELSKELTAALTEARDKARDLESKLAAEQVKEATLREEKQKLMSGTTTKQDEIARIQKRSGELETAAGRVGDLEKRLQERDQEIGKLRQAAADRELFASKVAALTQEREQLIAELAKQQEAMKAQKERLEARSGEQARPAQEQTAKEAVNQRLTKIHTDLTKSLKAEIAKGDIRIQQVRDRMTITIMDWLLFESGESQVKQAGLKILKRVGDVLKNVTGQEVLIEARTDNVQGGEKLTERFPANWRLCTARATNVVRSLVEKGGLDRATLSAVGCVDTRQLARNETEGRSTNRHIEIVLLLKDQPESTSLTTPQ